MQPLLWVFAVLQYLGNISPVIDKNIMGYGAAGVRDVIQNDRHLGFY